MMAWLSQIFAITATSIRSIGERRSSSLVAVVGIGGVVLVLVGVLSLRQGFLSVLDFSGSDDVAVVLRSGATDEMGSQLSQEQTRIIGDAPGVKQGANGPVYSSELYVVVDIPLRRTGTGANVPLRGVLPSAKQLRHHYKIVEGRDFVPGTFEIVAGRGAAVQFAGVEVGKKVRLGTTDWTIVGIFEDGGSVSESELWTGATVLQGAYLRGNSFQSQRVQLTNAAAFRDFKDSLTRDPRLSVRAITERAYYAEKSEALVNTVTAIGSVIAILMGLGAVFGALNTMYSAVSSRTREIATLRALGFGASPVVISVLVEAMLLGVVGGLIGSVIAYVAFNGVRASTMNMSSFSQMTFAFTVTPELLAQGLFYALILGFIGGLLPSLRAARMPITSGLREL
jgi:putative ABC transport system permease protein